MEEVACLAQAAELRTSQGHGAFGEIDDTPRASQ
jgi:hypothetical protein